MYIRYDELIENYGISHYIRPFSKKLWSTILFSIVLVGTCTFLSVYAIKPLKFDFLSALCHPIEAFTNQCKLKENSGLIQKNQTNIFIDSWQ